MKKRYDDNNESPELTDEFFQKARPARDVLTEDFGEEEAKVVLSGKAKVKVGRPRAANPKKLITLRIEQSVEKAFRDMGPGWQTKMNDALKEWLLTSHR